ncbi:hypothetical protein QZH41_012616, partial [Actinostola sp. cb2023]
FGAFEKRAPGNVIKQATDGCHHEVSSQVSRKSRRSSTSRASTSSSSARRNALADIAAARKQAEYDKLIAEKDNARKLQQAQYELEMAKLAVDKAEAIASARLLAIEECLDEDITRNYGHLTSRTLLSPATPNCRKVTELPTVNVGEKRLSTTQPSTKTHTLASMYLHPWRRNRRIKRTTQMYKRSSGVQPTVHGEKSSKRTTKQELANARRVMKTNTEEDNKPHCKFHDCDGHELTECKAFAGNRYKKRPIGS